ncbi:hypothetical protein ACR6C2_16230 [Streptomyces sp. INA 01156]
MSQLTMEYGGTCKKPATAPRVRTLGKYANNVTDPDGDNVAVQFEAKWDTGDGKGLIARWKPAGPRPRSPGPVSRSACRPLCRRTSRSTGMCAATTGPSTRRGRMRVTRRPVTSSTTRRCPRRRRSPRGSTRPRTRRTRRTRGSTGWASTAASRSRPPTAT